MLENVLDVEIIYGPVVGRRSGHRSLPNCSAGIHHFCIMMAFLLLVIVVSSVCYSLPHSKSYQKQNIYYDDDSDR
ncbi:hypothetical protein Y032_0409g933 [Ancylostoma ceylanicum]|uniref:Uncharacterized protein n=1 Tax=Ancylostoma ceylanicum TaxID=53326 RepID=A0A016X2M1_9BILA|nr:hypothetical protein Y032_0409g933 [Ancylostoma ceylanicum]